MVRNSKERGVSCQYYRDANKSSAVFDVPGKSMVPLLSASTSLIMSCSSDSDGF